MSRQKAFKKSNLHLMIWIYRERRDKEIVCNKKYTLSIENGIIGVTKLRQCYIDNQVEHQQKKNTTINFPEKMFHYFETLLIFVAAIKKSKKCNILKQ